MNDIRSNRGGGLRGQLSQMRQRTQQNVSVNSNLSSAPDTPQPAGGGSNAGQNSAGNRSSKKAKLLLTAGGTLIVLLTATSGFFFWQYKSSASSDEDAAATSQRVIQAVGGLYILPEDEEPTVAEIRDKDRLGDQAFFDNAENGDYLLVYEHAGLALIYRESVGKLVNVSPVGTTPSGEAAGQQDMPGGVPSDAMSPPKNPDKPVSSE